MSLLGTFDSESMNLSQPVPDDIEKFINEQIMVSKVFMQKKSDTEVAITSIYFVLVLLFFLFLFL